jgi:hypothetical protein
MKSPSLERVNSTTIDPANTMAIDVISIKESRLAEFIMAKTITPIEAMKPTIVAMSISILWSNDAD